MTWAEAEGHNDQAARLMAEIASSDHPHFFFSYESLIFLGHTYLQGLYTFLGTASDFLPPIVDANVRYLKQPLEEGGPRESERPSL